MADEQRVSQGGVTVASEIDSVIRISQGGVTVAADPPRAQRISQAGITVAAHPIPLPPSNLVATAMSPFTIALTWDNNVMDRDGLIIERSLDDAVFVEIATIGADETSYDDLLLDPSTTYYYRVSATLNGVDGTPTASVNATTLAEAGGLPQRWFLLRRHRGR